MPPRYAAPLVAVLTIVPGVVDAGAGEESPCIQPLVPEMSYRLLWAGAPLEPHFETWDRDRQRAEMVARVAPLTTSDEQARARLVEYLKAHAPVDEMEQARVFAGIFLTLNTQRSDAISAAKRYKRGQQAALSAIADRLRRLDRALKAEPRDEQAINDLRSDLHWMRRAFDARRTALEAVCAQPTLIEQRMGDLLRVLRSVG